MTKPVDKALNSGHQNTKLGYLTSPHTTSGVSSIVAVDSLSFFNQPAVFDLVLDFNPPDTYKTWMIVSAQ